MRVTQRSLQDNWLQDVQSRLQSVDQLNQQIGSGKRVEQPGDDPAAASRIVRLQELVARNDQYLKNIDEALSVQKTADSALEQVSQNLVRAKSLAVEGATTSGISMAPLAQEIDGIRTGILALASSQYEGKFLFSGTKDEIAPFAAAGRYLGNAEDVRVNTGSGQSIALNMSGDRAFRELSAQGTKAIVDASNQVIVTADVTFTVTDGLLPLPATITVPAANSPYTPAALAQEINDQLPPEANLEARLTSDGRLEIAIADSQAGGEITIQGGSDLEPALGLTSGTKNVFGLLSDLEAALASENPEAVSKLLDRLDRALDAILGSRGELGARTRNLEFVKERLTTNNVTSQTLQEQIEGVDLPKAVTKLSAEQQAYQTALAAGARIFNVSLLDYLR